MAVDPQSLGDATFRVDDVVSQRTTEKPFKERLRVIVATHDLPFGFIVQKAIVAISWHTASRTRKLIDRDLRSQRWLLVKLLEEAECRRQRCHSGSEITCEPLPKLVVIDGYRTASTDRCKGTSRLSPSAR